MRAYGLVGSQVKTDVDGEDAVFGGWAGRRKKIGENSRPQVCECLWDKDETGEREENGDDPL